MAPNAQVVSLKVRPIQSVDLCFEVTGVISEQNFALAQFGARLSTFDLPSFYAGLLAPAGVATRPGLLKFDSAAIRSALTSGTNGGPLLFALRAENVKALLDKEIKARENAFYKRYVRTTDVITLTRQFFQPTAAMPTAPAITKPDRLDALADLAQAQRDALNNAYVHDPSMSGVARVTTTKTISVANIVIGDITSGSKDIANIITNVASLTNVMVGTPITGDGIADSTTIDSLDQANNKLTMSAAAMKTATGVSIMISNGVGSNSAASTFNQLAAGTPTTESNTVSKTNSDTTTTNKLIANTPTTSSRTRAVADPGFQQAESKGYTFRHPTNENETQNHRTQVSLLDERYQQFMFSQQLPFLETSLQNEIDSLDLEVKRLQVSFINSILVCPITGVVTGVFADVGDCVRAGDPVLRVERDDTILIVGTIKFRKLLQIGAKVDITTNLFDASPPTPVPLPQGTVVAIRGHDHEDERWDVIIQCPNLTDTLGVPTIPITYTFDYDDTEITIS
jgi:biotin carboxyl carrier protein